MNAQEHYDKGIFPRGVEMKPMMEEEIIDGKRYVTLMDGRRIRLTGPVTRGTIIIGV